MDSQSINVLEMLHSLKGVTIEKIKYDSEKESKTNLDLIKLQVDSMKHTWDNPEDEAWNDL